MRTMRKVLLIRAADLIGQLGDPHYLRKANALYREFEEAGINRQLGYASPADLVDRYPQFYWNSVSQRIETAIRYLNVTSSGRQWIATLCSNIFPPSANLARADHDAEANNKLWRNLNDFRSIATRKVRP